MERLDCVSTKTPARIYILQRKSQGKRQERRSHKTTVEERTQQSQSERHGHRANKGTRHLHRRGKTTTSPKRTLLPVQPKGTHRQKLPPKKHTSCGSIHVKHPSNHSPNPRTCERCAKGTSPHRYPPRGICRS